MTNTESEAAQAVEILAAEWAEAGRSPSALIAAMASFVLDALDVSREDEGSESQ